MSRANEIFAFRKFFRIAIDDSQKAKATAIVDTDRLTENHRSIGSGRQLWRPVRVTG